MRIIDRREYLKLLAGRAAALPLAAKPVAFRFRQQPARVRVLADSKPYTDFHFAPKWGRPFLHPLVTPSGIEISRGVPPKAGEDSEFPWQRGLWYGHGDINGIDFWSEPDGEGDSGRPRGRMVVSQAPTVDEKTATLSARADLTSSEGKILGGVTQQFRFSANEQRRVVDVAISISAGSEDLVLGDTAEGGLAFRLTDEFRDDRGVDMLNSEGVTGVDIWGKPARWVDYSARMFGRMVGVAILDHPRNVRYPTRWHAQDGGLNAANPFGAGSFKDPKSNGPKTEGHWIVQQGSALTLRYRVIVHEGDAAEAGIETLHADYSRAIEQE